MLTKLFVLTICLLTSSKIEKTRCVLLHEVTQDLSAAFKFINSISFNEITYVKNLLCLSFSCFLFTRTHFRGTLKQWDRLN